MVDPREGSLAGGDVSGIDPRFQEGQPNPMLRRKRRLGKRWPLVLGGTVLAVGIFANKFIATANRAVDRADNHRRIAEPVEMFNDRDLMWDRAVEADPAHSAGAFDSVRKLLRGNLAIDVPDIKPMMPIRRFHHGDSGVLRRRHRSEFRRVTSAVAGPSND